MRVAWARSGRAGSRLAHIGLLLLLAASGCNYSFRGGSFPPPHIRTLAILPFENETTRFELTEEIHTRLLRTLPSSLGIRPGGEDVADALVRGSITAYDVASPNYRTAAGGDRAEVIQQQVILAVSVEIVDRVNNAILWESRSLRAEGQFADATETEEDGRLEAIELLVQRIVDGAQSNW